MARRHTKRAKKPHRHTHRKRTRRVSRGGGWSEGPNFVSPGNLIHNQYAGPGKDCTGNPASLRPGYIAYYTPEGLPGHGPGWSRGGRRRRKHVKGGALSVAANQLFGPVTDPNKAPVSGCLTPKPDYFPATEGVGGTVANPAGLPVIASWPGAPVNNQPLMPKVVLDASADGTNLIGAGQNGGSLYGTFPGMGPLNAVSGIGTSPAPFGRTACERGTFNPLNPNPDNIQRLTTASPLPPYVTGRMQGGAELMGAPTNVGSSGFSSANFPVVRVGDADSMRYYAPTAGYRNDFMTFRAPSAVPGLTLQTPYDARAFNQACIKTGGGKRSKRSTRRKSRSHRKGHKRGGAAGHSIGQTGHPIAEDAGEFSKITIDQVQDRFDFDQSHQGLPVKFGGKRSRSKKSRKCRK